MEILSFRFPTDIRFGAGARGVLAEFAEKHNVSRPLLVTDSGLVRTEAFSLAAAEAERVWGQGCRRFTGVGANPTDQDVEDAWQAYDKGQCDGIVGLGGGSALDAAKAMRLKVFQPRRLGRQGHGRWLPPRQPQALQDDTARRCFLS